MGTSKRLPTYEYGTLVESHSTLVLALHLVPHTNCICRKCERLWLPLIKQWTPAAGRQILVLNSKPSMDTVGRTLRGPHKTLFLSIFFVTFMLTLLMNVNQLNQSPNPFIQAIRIAYPFLSHFHVYRSYCNSIALFSHIVALLSARLLKRSNETSVTNMFVMSRPTKAMNCNCVVFV